MKNNKSYILIFTITIISLITVLTHQFLRLVYVGTHFNSAMIDRERAEMLALGGINLAIAQLTLKKPAEKGDPKKDKLTPEEQKQKSKKEFSDFLKRLLPHINRWQVFPLTEDLDGMDGEIKLCISCENGKININDAFDFQKQEFKPLYKKLLTSLKLGKRKSSKRFIQEVTNFFKKRNKKLEDISQLQAGSETSVDKLFYEPPLRTPKQKNAKPNTGVALSDIFTTWTDTQGLEALFLSDALCALLRFRRPAAYDVMRRKGKFETVIKNFDPNVDQNKPEYWKMVNPLYETKTGFKIENVKIFSPKFEPTTYSVLSSGKVGNVEQTILAILEKVPQPPDESTKDKKSQQKEKSEATTDKKEKTKRPALPFRIVQLYWI